MIPEGTSVVAIEPGPEILSRREFMTSKARRRLLSFTRGGSAFGVWFERTARRIIWRLRYVDRVAIVWRSAHNGTDEATETSSQVLERLEAIHRATPNSQLVAFDVFDLPSLLDFGERHDITVLVR